MSVKFDLDIDYILQQGTELNNIIQKLFQKHKTWKTVNRISVLCVLTENGYVIHSLQLKHSEYLTMYD